MQQSSKLPFYLQLSEQAAQGVSLLDKPSADELKQFILSQQNSDGGFSDRAGNSDLYYSLFAHLILRGFDYNYIHALRSFIQAKQKSRQLNLVETCSLAILNKDINRMRITNWVISARLIKQLFGSEYSGSKSYQFFLVFLALDAFGLNNRISRILVRRWFRKIQANDDMPCPALAAQIVLKKQLGLPFDNDVELLLNYLMEGSGFKTFPAVNHADMLSTAVALTALKMVGHPLSLLSSGCLQFIEDHYEQGAFLSGDGDLTRDIEYTFYGLLALGALA